MSDPAATAPCPTFEEALEHLEQIVRQLEDGQLGLEDSLGRYEHGVGLIKHCFGVLERVERRIELLSGVDAQGNPVTEPLSDEASFQPQSGPIAADRKASRTTKSARKAVNRQVAEPSNDMDDSTSLF